MRNVANSVTVVTTDGPAGKYGATVSSFCSVSADPPTVLVCLNFNGQTAHAIRQNGTFCVNVLSENMAATAELFAGVTIPGETSQFNQGYWIESETRDPQLPGITAFACEIIEIVEATSHLVFIGSVCAVQFSDKKPLLYLDRTFSKTASL